MRARCAATLTLGLDPQEFRRGTLWLEELGRRLGIPKDPAYALNVCLNEALANVACHSGVDREHGNVEVALDCSGLDQGAAATLLLCYGGVEFDPRRHVPRPAASSLDDALAGGGGIAMMRAFADELHYARESGRNELAFTVRWKPCPDNGLVQAPSPA